MNEPKTEECSGCEQQKLVAQLHYAYGGAWCEDCSEQAADDAADARDRHAAERNCP